MLRTVIGRQFQVFSVLRHREFRVYWTGLQFQITGLSLTYFTLGYLAFHLTGSALHLSFVTLALAGTSITLNMVGGVVADRLDPRHVLTTVQSIAAVVVSVLAFLTLTERLEIWHLIVGASLVGAFSAFDQPNRHALFPRLLPDRRQLANAVPLISLAWDINRIASPAAAGFMIHAAGAEISLFVGAVGFIIMAATVQLLRPRPVSRATAENMFRNLQEGFRYIRSHPLFRVLFGTSYLNNFLGMSYIFVLPIFAEDVLHVDARGLGIIASTGPVGGIAAGLTVPRLLRRYSARSVITLGTIGFGGFLMAFAASPWYILSVLLMVGVGYSVIMYVVGAEVTLQMHVPDELRGRVMGLYGITWIMPTLGAAAVAAVANFVGAPLALGGAAALIIVNILAVNVFSPALRNLGVVDASDPPAPASAQARR